MPTAVAFSQLTGVGDWGCPISAKVICNTLPSLIFKNSAPNSASAADEAMNLMTVYGSSVWVGCSVAATPKNSGLRICFEPLVQINNMYPCVSGE